MFLNQKCNWLFHPFENLPLCSSCLMLVKFANFWHFYVSGLNMGLDQGWEERRGWGDLDEITEVIEDIECVSFWRTNIMLRLLHPRFLWFRQIKKYWDGYFLSHFIAINVLRNLQPKCWHDTVLYNRDLPETTAIFNRPLYFFVKLFD
jgi:hypothetical protein